MFVCRSSKAIEARSPVKLSEERGTPSYGELYQSIRSRTQSLPVADIILHPTTDHVERVVSRGPSDDFTRLAHSYFRSTDSATSLCISLQEMLEETRGLYRPLYEVLSSLPIYENGGVSSLTESLCDTAYHELARFNTLQIPFLEDGYQNCQQEFIGLIERMNDGLHESRMRPQAAMRRSNSAKSIVSAMRRSVSCLRIDAGGMIEPKTRRGDMATKGFFVMNAHLDGLRREAELVKVKVEGHRNWVKIGVDMGPERWGLFGILRELWKNQEMLVEKIVDLERELCRCLNCILRTRKSIYHLLPMNDVNPSPSLPSPS